MFIVIMDVIVIVQVVVIAGVANVIVVLIKIIIAIIVEKKFRAKIHVSNYALVSNVVLSNIKRFIKFFSYIQNISLVIYFYK